MPIGTRGPRLLHDSRLDDPADHNQHHPRSPVRMAAGTQDNLYELTVDRNAAELQAQAEGSMACRLPYVELSAGMCTQAWETSPRGQVSSIACTATDKKWQEINELRFRVRRLADYRCGGSGRPRRLIRQL